jgi:membrane associated rhomboid family serine protease
MGIVLFCFCDKTYIAAAKTVHLSINLAMSLTIVLVIMTGLISFQAFNNPAMREKLLFRPYFVKENGEWYRFVTHGFVHADWTHLLVNMFVLWQFGKVIESVFTSLIFGQTLGKIAFLALYLSAIIVAAVPSFIRHANAPYYGSLGASGATSALVFGYILFAPWNWFLFPPLPAIILGVVYLWYSSYMSKRGADNIAHDAHFWGAVYGLAFVLVSIVALNPTLLDYILSELLAGPKPPNF